MRETVMAFMARGAMACHNRPGETRPTPLAIALGLRTTKKGEKA